MAATKDAQSSPFIRQLASSDKRIRDRALSSLRTYLQRAAPFTDLELRKLWKGLFYCMWMSDKPRNQQLLARDLADLLDVVARVNFIGFAQAFWTTIAAEWNNIDRLRLDKFLYLIRCYVNTGFSWVQRHGWNSDGMLEQYLDVLKEVPLNARDAKIPNGLRYHVIDIYVDELDKVDTNDDAPLAQLLAPLKEMKKSSLTKTVRDKCSDAIEDERLKNWAKRRELDDDDDEVTEQFEEPLSANAQIEDEDDDFADFGD